jgi:hypothetical protein
MDSLSVKKLKNYEFNYWSGKRFASVFNILFYPLFYVFNIFLPFEK